MWKAFGDLFGYRGQFEWYSENYPFARLKKFHQCIITPTNLVSAISQNLVSNNLNLPVKLSRIAEYLEIVQLQAYQHGNNIEFILKNPLVDQQIYTLCHLFLSRYWFASHSFKITKIYCLKWRFIKVHPSGIPMNVKSWNQIKSFTQTYMLIQ